MCIDDLAAVFSETYTYDNASRTLKMTSPKFGADSSVTPALPSVPSVDDKNEELLKLAAENYIKEYLGDLTNFDSLAITELTELGDIYGNDLISDYMQLLNEVYNTINWKVTGVDLTAGGAEIDVRITARNLEGVFSEAITEALTKLTLEAESGKTLTDDKIAAIIIGTLFDKIGDDSRSSKTFNVTVYTDIDSKGNISVDLNKNSDLINAMLGGLLNDPLLGN